MPSLSLADVLLVLLYAAVLLLPGLLVAIAAGLRGWTSLAVAPLLGYGIAAVVGPMSSAGLTWGPLTLLAAATVLGLLCLGLGLLTRRWERPPASRVAAPDRTGDLVVAGGILLAAALGAAAVLIGIGSLRAIHQDWDAIFHANAVRFILDTGNADPSALRAINNYEDASFFYPNAYHAVAAVVGKLSGGSVPELLNAQMLLLPGMAGLGLAALVRRSGGRVALAAVTPIVLVTFTGFAYDMLFRGPLLPFVTGIALVPAFLLALEDALSTRRVAAGLVVALASVGLLGLHPSAALTAAVFAVPMLAYRWVTRPGHLRAEAAVLLGVGAVSVLLGLQFALGALSVGGTGDVVDFKAGQTPGQAVGDLLLLNHARQAPQFWLVALLIVGGLTVKRIRPLWWWLVGASAFGGLFVAAAAYDDQWAETITRPWWNDSWRFVAIAILGLAVVAAHGAVVSGEYVLHVLRRRLRRPRLQGRVWLGGAIVAVLAVFGVASNGFYVPANGERMQVNFGDGPTVTSGERAGMRALADMARPGDRVMNDPLDGSAWMYALVGLRPVFGHVVAPRLFGDIGADQQELLSSFRCLDSDPKVRELVARYRIRYVFVGEGYVRDYFHRIPGLLNLSPVDSLHLVYARDGVAIYRVDMGQLTPQPEAEPACGDAAS